MAITKEKKKSISEKLEAILDKAGSLVFVNFHGLAVADEATVRKTLKGKQISYYVAKKTLVKRALETKKYDGDMPVFEGELAIVSGEDSVLPASSIYEFVKKHRENLRIMGGVFEGRYQNAAEMSEIAMIPKLEVLYGQVVNLINSPIQGFVMALGAIADKKED